VVAGLEAGAVLARRLQRHVDGYVTTSVRAGRQAPVAFMWQTKRTERTPPGERKTLLEQWTLALQRGGSLDKLLFALRLQLRHCVKTFVAVEKSKTSHHVVVRTIGYVGISS
jgi:hypothetical protein